MADAVKSLDIILRTQAELKGAEQLAAQLESQIGKAKALGKDYSELNTQLGKVRDSIKNYAGPTEEAAQKSEGLADKLKGVRGAAEALGRQFPIVGQAIRAFLNPIALAATAATFVFAKVKASIEDLNRALDAQAEIAAGKIGDIRSALRQAQSAATDASLDYLRSLDDVAQGQDRLAIATQNALSAIRAQARAMTEVVDAQEALALAQVDEAETKGTLSPQQAIKRRLDIRKGFAAQRDLTAERAGREELRVREEELKARQQRQPQLDAAAEAALRAANDPKRNATLINADTVIKDLQDLLKGDREVQSTAEAARDAAEARLRRAERWKAGPFGWLDSKGEGVATRTRMLGEAQAEVDSARSQAEQTQAAIDAEIARKTDIEREREAAKDALDRARRDRDANESAIMEQEQSLGRDRSAFEIESDARRRSGPLRDQRIDSESSRDLHEQIKRDAEAEERRNNERVRSIQEAGAAMTQAADDITAAVAQLGDNVTAALAQVKSEVIAQAGRIADSYNV